MGGEQRSDGCVDCDETGDDDEGGRDYVRTYGDDGVDAGDGHGGDTKYGHDNGGAKDVDMYVPC